MDQVSVNIPDQLYKLLQEEAGSVPVDHYITSLLSRARRYRPQLAVVDNVDSFLQALKPWEDVVGKVDMTVHGGTSGGRIRALPNGRVQIITGGWFWAMGPRIEGTMIVGELSERFSQDGQPNATLISRGKQSIVPWEQIAPEEPPLDDNDKSTFERINIVGDRIRAALARLGVRRQDELRRVRDDAIDEEQGPRA